MTPADDARLVAYSRDVIRSGSKSFAAAATLFEPRTRAGAYLLYAWCRHCDDVADGQTLGHGATAAPREAQLARVAALERETRGALAGEPAAEPVFQAFQAVAQVHGLPPAFALDHLSGFRWDAEGRPVRDAADLLDYCYRVAGAVGLMMAWIMGVRDEPTLDRACDLGLAFQLTNIARDVLDDAAVGRVYLPEDWLAEAGVPPDAVGAARHRGAVFGLAERLVGLAEPYYASARWGMARLPFRSACAVGAARGVYRRIGRKLVRQGPEAWAGRLSTSRAEKLAELGAGVGAAVRARLLDARRAPPSRDGLWTRPASAGDAGQSRLARAPVGPEQPLGEGAERARLA